MTSTDSGGLTTVGYATITVNDTNDAPTAIALSSFSVNENTAGAVVGTLSTTDVDASDSHTYTLSGTDASYFEVVDGKLKLKSSVTADYETKSSYAVTVTSTDSGGLTTSGSTTITVNDVNEAPTGISISSVSVNENSAGAVVGTLSTTDVDASDSHTYTLSGTDASSFEVVDGKLKLKSSVSADYETKNSYAVTVTSTDSGGLTKVGYATITVNDVNEAPTGISISSVSVNESAAGAVVGTLSTTDVDASDTHTYTLSGTDASSFEVVSGQLKLKDSVTADYETKSSYAVTVTTTDSGGLSTSGSTTITVNDTPTDIALSNSSVDESQLGKVVGNLTTTDANSSDTHTYTLSGTDASYFEVVSGQLKLKATKYADYEVKSTLSVTVTATDQGGLSLSEAFSISVNDLAYATPYAPDIVLTPENTFVSSSYSGLNTIDQLLLGWTLDPDDDASTPLTVTYSVITTDSVFASDYIWKTVLNNPAKYPDNNFLLSNNVTPSSAFQTAVDNIFQLYNKITGITFTEVTETATQVGDIRIGLNNMVNTNLYGSTTAPSYLAGSGGLDIWMNNSNSDLSDSSWANGSQGFFTLLHEIGHTLGLDHPHDDTDGDTLNSAYDAVYYTVMAYADYVGDSTSGPFSIKTTAGQEAYPYTPMPMDIQALQWIYNWNDQTNAWVYPENNSGDDTYTLNGIHNYTIYDTGGTDTLDFSAQSLDLTINLDEYLSFIGDPLSSSSSGQAEFVYDNDEMYSGYTVGIYNYNQMENVDAGSGDDTITCNTSINIINCGAGIDLVYNVAAGDTVNGNDDNDAFSVTNNSFTLIDGGSGNDYLYLHDANSANSSGDIDLRDFTDAQFTSIEVINIQDSTARDLIITKEFIADYLEANPVDVDSDGDTDNIVYIYADSTDKIYVPSSDGWSYDSSNDSENWRFYSTDSDETWFAINLSAGNIAYTFTGSSPPTARSADYARNQEFSNDNVTDDNIILTGDYFSASTIAAEHNPLGSIASESYAENITLPETAPADGPPFTFSEEEVLNLLSEMIELNPSDLIDDESLLLADLSDEAPSTQSTENYSVEATDQVANAFMADHYDDIMNYEILVGVSELG